jgi:hypothetical protein
MSIAKSDVVWEIQLKTGEVINPAALYKAYKNVLSYSCES